MSVTPDLIEANQRFADEFSHGDLPIPPARGLVVLTCMDARLHPERFLGLQFGDAHVIRNAGGRASDDAIRSLIISSRLLGTREYVVIHHTDCGMVTFSNEDLRSRLVAETEAEECEIDFLPFDDLEESVREDVQRIAASPFIDNATLVSGYIYDVSTGRLAAVEGATAGTAS